MDFGEKFAFKLPRSILRMNLFHGGEKKSFLVGEELNIASQAFKIVES